MATLSSPLYDGIDYTNSYAVGGKTTTSSLVNTGINAVKGALGPGSVYINMDGMDLVWSQAYLQSQMAAVQTDIVNIENNANLSDEEKMFALQMATEAYDEMGLCRTSIMKGIDDINKTIARNCG
jgi:type III secretion protein F